MKKKFPLSQRSFRNWLKGKPADQVIGYANMPSDCPCNRCIVEINPQYQGQPVRVERYWTVIGYSQTERFSNPSWLIRFTRTVDNLNAKGYSPITAGIARKIFRNATRPGRFGTYFSL